MSGVLFNFIGKTLSTINDALSFIVDKCRMLADYCLLCVGEKWLLKKNR